MSISLEWKQTVRIEMGDVRIIPANADDFACIGPY